MRFTEEDKEMLLSGTTNLIKGQIEFGGGFNTEKDAEDCAKRILLMFMLGLEE